MSIPVSNGFRVRLNDVSDNPKEIGEQGIVTRVSQIPCHEWRLFGSHIMITPCFLEVCYLTRYVESFNCVYIGTWILRALWYKKTYSQITYSNDNETLHCLLSSNEWI